MLLIYLFLAFCVFLIVLLFLIIRYYIISGVEKHCISTPDYLQHNLRHVGDELRNSILELINDMYSPFYPARLNDHIYTDLDIDSLDILDLLFDIEQICGAKLPASGLYEKYGKDPTVAQLISYVRQQMKDAESTTESTTS